MAEQILFGNTSNLIRFTLKNKTTGQGKTGISTATSGLIISTICDVESSPTVYTGSNLQTIASLGTFVGPTTGKCRIGEVHSTNHPGLYEFQFSDARFAVSNARKLVISVNDAEATILDTDYQILLTKYDPYNSVNLGLSAISAPHSGTAQSGSISTTIKLDSGASSVDGFYNYGMVLLTGNTGAGQSGYITGYVGSTKVATIAGQWGTTPDNTTTFIVIPNQVMPGNGIYDMRQIMIMAWEMIHSGKLSGLPGSPATLRDFFDTVNRAQTTFDGNNNRTGVTIITAP